MKGAIKVAVAAFFFVFILSAVPRVSAQIVFPECRWDEITSSCLCPHADNMCADNTCSACLTYKNDPRYRYLWKDIYCRKASPLEMIDKYRYSFVIPFIVILALELAYFAMRGYRSRRELLSVALVNCISVLVGLFLLRVYPFVNNFLQIPKLVSLLPAPVANVNLYGMDIPRLLSLVVIGAALIVFEALFLIHIAKFGDRKRVFMTAAVAHFISLFLGLGILNAVYPHFLQPRLF